MARLILPGWHGSGPGHWQRYWLDEDPAARIVEQDDWDRPDLDAWIARLGEYLAREPQPATLIAHSLGTILVAHYVARHGAGFIGAALLVAPGGAEVEGPKNPLIAGFAPVPRAKLPFPSILVVSRNDPLMAHDRAVQLGRDWGARIVDKGNAGHINVAAGYGRWPEALQLADEAEAAAVVASA